MKSSAKNIQIASYDDLFKTDEERSADTQERIQELPLNKLLPFPNHPFKIVDDEKMQDTVDSIKEYGVLVPILVRPKDDGNYEIISGHRRHHASILAGKTEIPAIIREMDDDAAILVMVDSNLQRETILPSEKAFAYKMKLEAMKRQGARTDLTCAQFGHKLDGQKSRDILAEQVGESKNQIQRYIRLTNLQPELLDMVDNKQMAFNSAVEVSYLPEKEQTQLYGVLEMNECCPSLSQASAQRPDATAVLELDKWNKQFKRWINKGAHGIAVFADDKGNGRLKYYFDVSDTHTSHYSSPLPIWEMDMRYEGEVIEALENTFGDLKNKKTLVEAIFSASNNAVADNISDYLHDLKRCVEDSFLEELDELNIAVEYRQLLETSVAYMLLTRLSIDADDYITREDFVNLNDFNTLPTINALGIATGDIAEMGLREISRTVISLRKAQFFENSGNEPYDNSTEEINIDEERGNDYGSDLQGRGRLQDAQPLYATAAGSSSGQVRGATQTVSDEAPQSALHEPQDDSQADGTSGGNRETGNDDDRGGNLEDGSDRGRDGEPEADQSNEVDRPYEQLPTFNGGNSLERPDSQLNVTDEAGGKNELPAFLNEHLIQAIVLDDGGRTVKRQEIFGYFQSHKDYKQRCEFLKNAYMETYVEILVDETRIGFKKQENGLLMWEGSYLSKTSASVFSWAIITEITENLIERGEYKIQLGLQNMPSVTEQLALFDMGGNVPVYEIDGSEPVLSLFPEKAIPQEVVDRALYTAGNQNGSVLRVVVQYMRERPEEENLAFLRREFGKNNGRGIEYDGHKYAVWFTEDGIRFAQGNSVRTGRSRTTVSWEDCSKRILELLYEGCYVSQSELDSAYETVLKSCNDIF